MKPIFILFALLPFYAFAQTEVDSLDIPMDISQESAFDSLETEEYPILKHYLSLEIGTGHGQERFGELAPDVMFQFHTDWVYSPFPSENVVGLGLQFGLVHLATTFEDVPGGNIESHSNLFDISLLGRIRVPFKLPIRPYFDISYGLGISHTKSKLIVVDEATFLEELLFDEEDEISKETVKKFSNTRGLFGLGAGLEYKKRFYVHFRMYNGGDMEFVNEEGIRISDSGGVTYDQKPAKLKFYTIGVGINFHNLLR